MIFKNFFWMQEPQKGNIDCANRRIFIHEEQISRNWKWLSMKIGTDQRQCWTDHATVASLN